MTVWLYRVGRNLNRCYRTCEAFGIEQICLVECPPVSVGNVFAARGRVIVSERVVLPEALGVLALETHYVERLRDVEWCTVRSIVLGGESSGLPRRVRADQTARIPTVGRVSGLTVEAALAIALYARSEVTR